MSDELSLESFESCEPKTYRLHSDAAPDGEALELELAETETLGEAREEGVRAPFSLLFRGPPEPVLPQRIYRLENDELGTLEIFLVPVGSDEEGTEYEAVFT